MTDELDPPPPPEGDEEWWPGYPDIDQQYRRPAFSLQRDHIGYVKGGDWVRGSAFAYEGTLTGAATPLPTTPPLNSLWLLGSPPPTAAPSPPAPAAKAAGQAIFWDGTSWTNVGVVTLPVQTAVRYSTGTDLVAAAVAQRGVLYSRAYDYGTIEVFWGIPGKLFDKWAEVSIVRSAFGFPSTVNDGQTIFREFKNVLFPETEYPNGVPADFTFRPIYDVHEPTKADPSALTGGRYYYYSLFFRINFEWARSFTSSTLLPRNHHHAEHLWEGLPPFYRWTDLQNSNGETQGTLQRFLRVFGFELDTWREYVENWQELYHTDFTPVPLLRRLGENFGVPFESGGIGDIRYRSLLAEIGRLYEIRGTRPCLERVCEAVSKYECDVTQTGNLMTLPDDSDFFEGTGNWAGLNQAYDPENIFEPIAPETETVLVTPDKVFLKHTKAVLPPVGYGRGVMEVWTHEDDETTDLLLTCGSGIAYDVYTGEDNPLGARYIYPLQVGVLVDNEGVYLFSAQIKMEVPSPVALTILWYNTQGGVEDYIGKTDADFLAPLNTNWKAYETTGVVPDNAVYGVPAIYINTRTAGPDSPDHTSPRVYVAGAAMYLLGSAARVSSEGPNPYLRLGDEMKRIGEPIATPPVTTPPLPSPYPGYPIGKKQ